MISFLYEAGRVVSFTSDKPGNEVLTSVFWGLEPGLLVVSPWKSLAFQL